MVDATEGRRKVPRNEKTGVKTRMKTEKTKRKKYGEVTEKGMSDEDIDQSMQQTLVHESLREHGDGATASQMRDVMPSFSGSRHLNSRQRAEQLASSGSHTAYRCRPPSRPAAAISLL